MTLLAEIALVAIAALVVVAAVARLPRGAPPGLRRRGLPPPARPAQLERLERLVSVSGASALQAHAHLRPLLAEIAARRLAARGLALGRMGDEAGRELLGERLWDLVRPGRPFPEDRTAPGVSASELAAMVRVLESL